MEKLTFCDSTVEIELPGAASRSVSSSDVIGMIQSEAMRGLTDEPLPPCARWRVTCGAQTIWVLELEPALRWIRWLDPESPIPLGEEALYRDFRLATPYVVVVVPFANGRVTPRCEVFYRNEPLTGLDSELHWCNLLNVSPNSYGCVAWFCTQYLGKALQQQVQAALAAGSIDAERARQMLSPLRQLDAVLSHLWGGGFNQSSEHNEGKSCFSKASEDGLDPRVAGDVCRWEQCSIEDPRFVLDIAWKPTGKTVRGVIERHLGRQQQPRDLSDTDELINLLMARTGQPPAAESSS